MANKPIFDTEAFTQLTDKDKDPNKENMFKDISETDTHKNTQKHTQKNTQQETQDIYTTLLCKQDAEKRTKRVQIVVKPSSYDYIKQLQKDGVIKSVNDLINNFLEEFIEQAQKREGDKK